MTDRDECQIVDGSIQGQNGLAQSPTEGANAVANEFGEVVLVMPQAESQYDSTTLGPWPKGSTTGPDSGSIQNERPISLPR